MSRDQEIYNRVGGLLVRHAPVSAVKVIYRFSIDAEASSSEGAVYSFEYDYVDQSGSTNWFTIDDLAGSMFLTDQFIELRDFFVSQGQPAWKRCEFSVDLLTGKFSADFKYD